MKITQKKNSNLHTYTFEDDYLDYSYKDQSGEGSVELNYADFPQKSSVVIEQSDWLRNVGYLWIALGIFQLSTAINSGEDLSGKAFWISVGVTCLIMTHFLKVRYSVYKSEQGNIHIIQDKKHDQILSEINQRRHKQLLEWYGEVNPENELSVEINKLKWLAEQNIITTEEYEYKIAQAELINKNMNDDYPPKLN